MDMMELDSRDLSPHTSLDTLEEAGNAVIKTDHAYVHTIYGCKHNIIETNGRRYDESSKIPGGMFTKQCMCCKMYFRLGHDFMEIFGIRKAKRLCKYCQE